MTPSERYHSPEIWLLVRESTHQQQMLDAVREVFAAARTEVPEAALYIAAEIGMAAKFGYWNPKTGYDGG